MFWITRDPSSESFIQCLAKITLMVCAPCTNMKTVHYSVQNSQTLEPTLRQ